MPDLVAAARGRQGRIEGTFHDGRPGGRLVIVYGDGHRYEGEVKDYRLHGKGVLILPDGRREPVEHLDGKRVGR